MGFTHNSEVSPHPQAWGDVQKSKLPHVAFAVPGDASKKSSWDYPHHEVDGGTKLDDNGCWADGTLYVNEGGVRAASQRMAEEHVTGEPLEHIRAHEKALGIGPYAKEKANALPNEIIALNGAVPDWANILKEGYWLGHPNGPEVITTERLKSALDFFDRNYAAHGTDLVFDWHHGSMKPEGTGPNAPAAGWIDHMELREGGKELWGHVLWTSTAANSICSREYRYPSPVLRFNKPDPVTGEIVPLQIHSVALTNTPFMTGLASLNENNDAGAMDGPGSDATAEEGAYMKLLDLLANALGIKPEEAASKLGLDAGAEDKAAAEALVANAVSLADYKAKAGQRAALPDYVANALGVAPGEEDVKVRAAVIRLRAPGAGLTAVRAKLGLADDAVEADILNAITGLQAAHASGEAEDLVANAVQAGKVPPAHKQFWLDAAKNDLDAARECINSLPVLTAPPAKGTVTPPHGAVLTPAEERMRKEFGYTVEQMAAARRD